uniref:Histone H2A n=1 Tax=Theropithecus gelada TaxID=9565 RepID=A0A8D2G9X2_THEGE
MAGNKHNRSSCKPRRQRRSRFRRAELQFPVSHVECWLREGQYARRLSSTTPVFLAGVLQYLTANILEQAGKEAENSHRVRITPEHVKRALQKDEQLRWLLEKQDDTHSQEEEMSQPEEEEEERMEEEEEEKKEEEKKEKEEEEKKKGGFLSFRALRNFIGNLLQLPKSP